MVNQFIKGAQHEARIAADQVDTGEETPNMETVTVDSVGALGQ